MRLPEINTDYHMHSTFSPDGEHSIEDLCRQALALGFSEIAITEHMEWHPRAGSTFSGIEGYFQEIDRCRAEFSPLGLAVFSGVELGNPHEFLPDAREFLSTHTFDVVIGSMHWLGEENIHFRSLFSGRDPASIYADYFAEMGRMAAIFDLDFIAHFDRIFWAGTAVAGQPDPGPLEPVIRETVATIAQRGQGLELNTRFLNHIPNWNDTIITLLRWFREEGGQRVFVNSDAHRTGELGRNLDIAQVLLWQAGFPAPARLRETDAIVMPGNHLSVPVTKR